MSKLRRGAVGDWAFSWGIPVMAVVFFLLMVIGVVIIFGVVQGSGAAAAAPPAPPQVFQKEIVWRKDALNKYKCILVYTREWGTMQCRP